MMEENSVNGPDTKDVGTADTKDSGQENNCGEEGSQEENNGMENEDEMDEENQIQEDGFLKNPSLPDGIASTSQHYRIIEFVVSRYFQTEGGEMYVLASDSSAGDPYHVFNRDMFFGWSKFTTIVIRRAKPCGRKIWDGILATLQSLPKWELFDLIYNFAIARLLKSDAEFRSEEYEQREREWIAERIIRRYFKNDFLTMLDTIKLRRKLTIEF